MKQVTRTFYCQDCDHTFERIVLENVLTAVCPECKPITALLERIGLTPGQAVVAAIIGVALLNRD